jgi:16S rRNA (cytosine967-C5)-methyltransferase
MIAIPKKQKSPRELAVEILNRIDQKGGYAEPLLDAALSGEGIPNPHDRGLLTELVYGTLRMRGRLDWIVSRLYRGDDAALETPVRNIIRTGLYQLLFTDRIPPFAAVNEAVGIAKKGCPAAAGLVNAILRNALREKESIAWPDMARDPGRAIAVLHSHPRWLVERWLDEYGIDETIAICRTNNGIPPLVVRVNGLKTSREKAVAALAAEGITAEKTRFSPDGVLLSTPAAGLRETAAFRDGLVRVQDEASQLVARLVAPRPGERILDLCAGAGGKTLHMAALMENRGEIVAVDLHPDKLNLLAAEAGRLGVAIVKTHTADATAMPDLFRGAFDGVLLDAPCSGLGTLRRNPEIRWRIVPPDLEKSMSLQKRLLRKAADCVKPGGRLVYSVCTETPEENEAVVVDLLSTRSEFKRIPPEGIPPELVDADGFFRTFPHRHGTDGFFGAVCVRAVHPHNQQFAP